MKVSQRLVSLIIMAAVCIGGLLTSLVNMSSQSTSIAVLPTLIGSLLCAALWYWHWRNGKYANYIFIFLVSIMLVIVLPDHFVYDEVASTIFLPAVLALILTGPIGVVATALGLIVALLIRAGFQGIYTTPVALIVYFLITGGMALARLITDQALSSVQESARAAELSRTQMAQQAQAIEEANDLLMTQLDQQSELLNLVTSLETPILRLADGVLLAPVVGHIDPGRADRLLQRMLATAHAERAQVVIIDIGGVSLLDSTAAGNLIRTIQSLQIIGCRVILSGIAAQVAMTLVHQGINLDAVTIVRSPQEALELVL
ncbi:STAS domain-containing protein [Chloroflexia bacterium SDU3-3]|nr:STAS domain-containing protein [Chloroflexia bacterium SDU3-3]